jgi:hypothetical protein
MSLVLFLFIHEIEVEFLNYKKILLPNSVC